MNEQQLAALAILIMVSFGLGGVSVWFRVAERLNQQHTLQAARPFARLAALGALGAAILLMNSIDNRAVDALIVLWAVFFGHFMWKFFGHFPELSKSACTRISCL